MKADPGKIMNRTPLVLVGEFGSGKSELALQLAVDSARDQTVLVDLDMITPFFRSRDRQDELRRRGVRLVAPSGLHGGAGSPSMPPGVMEAMERAGRCIVDTGGGDAGIRVLGSLRPALERTEAACIMVVNPYRPCTRTLGEIAARTESLRRAGRVSVDGLFANPHLGELTAAEVILEGVQVVTDAALQLGLPVVGVGLTDSLIGDHGDMVRVLEGCGRPVVVISPRLRPDGH